MSKRPFPLDEEAMIELGAQLWRMRQQKHLYIYQLAKRTRVPIDAIDAMELGKMIDYYMLRKLFKYFGIKMHIVLEKIKAGV